MTNDTARKIALVTFVVLEPIPALLIWGVHQYSKKQREKQGVQQ